MKSNPQIGDPVLGGRYLLLSQILGGVGGSLTNIGEKRRCRFCGSIDRRQFKNTSHTFPEGLGNKWVFSCDECDKCNALFSQYDQALAESVGPFLTLGGTRGKENKVRQTGRTSGSSVLKRTSKGGKPEISVRVSNVNPAAHVSVDQDLKRLRLDIPIAGGRFIPRYAYKALSKMGLAMLPRDELEHYEMLLAWLQNPNDDVDFPILEVGLSFGSIGAAPSVVAGTLLKRSIGDDCVPYIIFIFCAGSVCAQIALRSDHMEDSLPPTPIDSLSIKWAIVLGPEEDHVRIDYGVPQHFNWSSSQLADQPIERLFLDFDAISEQGRFTPIFR